MYVKNGYLSQYFIGVIAKQLCVVEANPDKSNQHEFNGIASMKKLLGTEKQKFDTTFMFLDDENDPITDHGFLTWYDARENHPTRSEYRLFFPTTSVSKLASAGDVLLIALKPDKSILVIIAPSSSTIASQLIWLFGIDIGERFSISDNFDSEDKRLEYASKQILEQIGVTIEEQGSVYLDEMLDLFHGKFPTTKEFSSYARSTLKEINALDDPDSVLLSWLNREEELFRTLEKHIIQSKLMTGFKDVDEFISYSLSVQNRRKSRVGQSLENHFEEILKTRNILYDRTKITENKSKPDFIFPGINQYHDINFSVKKLTMLGAKSTCKDRWRQVLAEADRIEHKHLLTLEAAISTNQTNEMIQKKLQLVVPKSIHKTYTSLQQAWLMDIKTFLSMLQEKQEAVSAVSCATNSHNLL